MTVRTMLVSVDGSESSAATLQTALAVARRFDVHLDVLHVSPDPLAAVPAIGDGMSSSMADRLESQAGDDAAQRAALSRELFDRIMDASGVRVAAVNETIPGLSASWMQRTGRRHKVLARLGRVHDLIVVGHPSNTADMAGSLTVNALFDTGRPVLVAPPEPVDTVGRVIAIAWNGSAECARALGGASNFFADAERVVILSGRPDDPVSVVPELESYLARHGVAAETRNIEPAGKAKRAGRPLLEACAAVEADLLVMGATAVSRLREIALGNTTRDVLAGATIPVLMGH